MTAEKQKTLEAPKGQVIPVWVPFCLEWHDSLILYQP